MPAQTPYHNVTLWGNEYPRHAWVLVPMTKHIEDEPGDYTSHLVLVLIDGKHSHVIGADSKAHAISEAQLLAIRYQDNLHVDTIVAPHVTKRERYWR